MEKETITYHLPKTKKEINMKPEEKAKELIKKYTDQEFFCISDFGAKECALITVNEILNLGVSMNDQSSQRVYDFYSKVKIEIIKLLNYE